MSGKPLSPRQQISGRMPRKSKKHKSSSDEEFDRVDRNRKAPRKREN